jgi:hypothetical protein
VTLHWVDLAILLAFIAGGCSTFFILRRSARRSAADRQSETERQMRTLTDALHSLEARLANLRDTGSQASAATEAESGGSADLAAEAPTTPDQEDVAPEIMAAITAASMAFLGRHARLRSVRPMPSQQAVSPWSQQGRFFVQASHNLRSRR